MAFFRRGGIAGAFRNNSQLQQFVLPGVTPTGRLLGTGSYGSVEEVSLSAGLPPSAIRTVYAFMCDCGFMSSMPSMRVCKSA